MGKRRSEVALPAEKKPRAEAPSGRKGATNGAAQEESPRADAPPARNAPQASTEGNALITDEFTSESVRELPPEEAAAQADAPLKVSHSVRHQVAIPPGYDYQPLSRHVPRDPPSRAWPFTLDPFQQTSIYCIERSESVLVSAHTSAGKTIVAEYAIAQALRDGQRVVYTSPIKALSNQKYREFAAEFGDVGLMTGDVTINPSASCLVMTTEILRSMLYRGSEIMREVAWVIFDEIHYMRDKERGVVWEETIILLPRKVRYVFLSATIPNAMQFAEWVAHIHSQPCHVVYTDFRPTPLQHYLFPQGGNGIYLVVDEKSNFREDNFQKAMGALADARGEDPAAADSGKNRKGATKKGGAQGGPSDIYKIIKLIMLKRYNPVIVFAFSKRQCEALALQMSKLEFNTDEEQEMVTKVFTSAIESLSEEDRTLPQISHILPLLRRGIGIHHGGLLPILKEVIELLFQEGLLKVLFATETFSIGLNMPAKTVVFTAVRKWDGNEFRNLSSGEFIQMSGRAGRRGLDDRGIVIMMFDEKLEPDAAKTMVKGEADRLNSAFHLGYNMVLNLMRVEGVSPEYMLKNCFFQFQNAASVPQLEAARAEALARRDEIEVPDEEAIAAYYTMHKTLRQLQDDRREVIRHPSYALPFLQGGRLVAVRHEALDFGWGVVVAYQKHLPPKGHEFASGTPAHGLYVVDIMLHCATNTVVPKQRESAPSFSGITPPAPGDRGEWLVVPVLLSAVQEFSGIRIFLPKDVRLRDERAKVGRNVAEVLRRFPQGLPQLDPVKDMKINDTPFQQLLGKIEILSDRMAQAPIAQDKARCDELFSRYANKQAALDTVAALDARIAEAHNVLQLDELKCRKRVLRRLGFTNADDIVEKKGRVACEISTGDELLLTELVFNGTFNDLAPEQCAAILSCFVFTERSEHPVRLKEDLAAPLRVLQDTARRIARVSVECRLPVVEQEYVQSFKVELIEAVLQWCLGARFEDICKMTDVFEGSIIRAFRRLQELLRQMAQAAKAIGNDELEHKFEAALGKLERPNSIIFSPSLYL